MRKTVCVLSFFAAGLVQASDISVGLSNTSIAVDYTSAQIGKGLEFAVSGLRHVDRGNMVSGGFQVSQQVNASFKASVGFKGIGVFNDVKNASGVALGGAVDIGIPNTQIHIGAHGWHAPAITTSKNTRSIQDFGATVGYRILNNAEIYAAYRYIRTDFENRTEYINHDGGLFGLKMFF